MKLPDLPVYYYHDNFVEMISHVGGAYTAVLAEVHHQFIGDFRRLTRDAQCLLIRMINRRGRIFQRGTFRYAEIADIALALVELEQAGFTSALTEDHYGIFLACLSKNALVNGGKAAGLSDLRSSWPKPRLVEHLLSKVAFDAAFSFYGGHDYIVLGDTEAVEFLLYLYFGKTETSLKNFALRDLGILRTNKHAKLSARFVDEAEAKACFTYSRLISELDTTSEFVFRAAAGRILDGPVCESDYANDLRADAALKAGKFFEKSGDKDLAVELYRVGASAECNERLVRLLYAMGDRDQAEQLLRRMIDDPASDDEYTFASDFHSRKFDGQRTGRCTVLLRSATTLVVDDTWRSNPEAGVASVLRRQGFKVHYTENTLWGCLFGLLFWDELFESGQLHSNFDWMPQCLTNRTFTRIFAFQISDKLGLIATRAALPSILRTVASRWGKPNGLFAWDSVNVEGLRALLTAQPAGVASMLRLMCEDYRGMCNGFPDLMTEKEGAVAFVEVKAEGDAIRRNQMTRLRQLGSVGIPADIMRVDFRFDPEQDYVVVDIETTGSWSNGDRITEIGAVKVRNHEVVGEWHSLINPQRSIPANITRLTGITNDMVRDAPLFAEVADSFMTFMGDGIFVAHSVNFDYGFIAGEYGRLGRRFRFPKLCTCASMRRRYPGHKSYGLGALCEIYGISLKDHHRALCDARGTVHLLNLINAERSATMRIGDQSTAPRSRVRSADTIA